MDNGNSQCDLRGRQQRGSLAAVALLAILATLPISLAAQEAGSAPESRAAEVISERNRKAAALQPETNTRFEQQLI